jgi:uncharacterized protein
MFSAVTASELWSQAPRQRWWQRGIQVAPVRIVLGALFVIPAAAMQSFASRRPGGPLSAALALAATLGFLLAIAAFARIVERRPPRELARERGLVEWIAGFALGTFLLAATTGVLVLLGTYRIEGGGHPGALVHGILMFLPQSLFEEVLMRVLFFKIAEESLGTWVAMILQAALFGALHIGNPNATAVSALAIALEAGLLLAATYMLTRRVWLAWGLHLGWNWAQGSLFGIPVSGQRISSTWLLSTPTGPGWLTGGGFGVEASPVAVVLCLAVAIVVLRSALRRGQRVGYRAQRARIQGLRSPRPLSGQMG